MGGKVSLLYWEGLVRGKGGGQTSKSRKFSYACLEMGMSSPGFARAAAGLYDIGGLVGTFSYWLVS
jgi:hypothetical protein